MPLKPGQAGELRLRALELMQALQRRADSDDDVSATIAWCQQPRKRISKPEEEPDRGSQARRRWDIPNSTAKFVCTNASQSVFGVKELTTRMGTIPSAQIRADDVRILRLNAFLKATVSESKTKQ